jgi:hypothetical protein
MKKNQDFEKKEPHIFDNEFVVACEGSFHPWDNLKMFSFFLKCKGVSFLITVRTEIIIRKWKSYVQTFSQLE